jgi:hypothetical protein
MEKKSKLRYYIFYAVFFCLVGWSAFYLWGTIEIIATNFRSDSEAEEWTYKEQLALSMGRISIEIPPQVPTEIQSHWNEVRLIAQDVMIAGTLNSETASYEIRISTYVGPVYPRADIDKWLKTVLGNDEFFDLQTRSIQRKILTIRGDSEGTQNILYHQTGSSKPPEDFSTTPIHSWIRPILSNQ